MKGGELYTGESDGLEAEKARERQWERHRYRERVGETWGSLFCCERSESPAGGAALTICQRRHAYFPRPPGSSPLCQWQLSSPEQVSRETKALDWHWACHLSWFTQAPSGFYHPALQPHHQQVFSTSQNPCFPLIFVFFFFLRFIVKI